MICYFVLLIFLVINIFTFHEIIAICIVATFINLNLYLAEVLKVIGRLNISLFMSNLTIIFNYPFFTLYCKKHRNITYLSYIWILLIANICNNF